MSLVNLAHVCSHLQNASVARLGLTSIPYTKLHLSLALLLHKQGFLSQVKLGGPSPPASCFPTPVPDNRRLTGAPHRDRDPLSGEAALHEALYNRKSISRLRSEGFGAEALAFAREHRELTREQLMKDGWDTHAIEFIVENGNKTPEQLAEEGLDRAAINILQQHPLTSVLDEVRDSLAREGYSEQDVDRDEVYARVRMHLRKEGFSKETLAHFAGEARYATPRHLEQDGITVSAMGLDVPNQAITTIPEQYRDPDDIETEGVVTRANRASRRLWLGLKYWDGLPVLSKAKMVSKPTKRIWLDRHELGKVVRGSAAGEVKGMRRVGEIMAVTTDRGIMDARECVERKVGGMALCRIW